RQLLDEDRLMRVGPAAAAVLLGPGGRGVPGLAELAAPIAPPLLETRLAAPPAARLLGEVLRDPGANLLTESGLVGRVSQLHRASLTRLFAKRHARAGRMRDLAALLVYHVAGGQTDGAAGVDDSPVGGQLPIRHGAEVIRLQLERGEALTVLEAIG